MHPHEAISSLLDGRPVRELEPGLYSVFPVGGPDQRYDRRARAYDRMIGSRLYNRIIWGTSPEAYREFGRAAVAPSEPGWLLDAGCGTLLLTGETYCAAPDRPIVAVDQSLGMLRHARDRLRAIAGESPQHVILLQADLLDLPFAANRFASILSMGMLHLFPALEPILESFRRALRTDGTVFLSSLVATGRLGDRYLRLLHRAGEVASPRTASALETDVMRWFAVESSAIEGNMSFIRALPRG